MKPIRFVRQTVSRPKCHAPSSTRVTHMHCELPPDHVKAGWTFHFGRNRIGAWRSWALKPEEM